MPTVEESTTTREKLIEAAGKLFADLGFTAVSVREIAAEAGVHFSLVNYHFGSKKELYRAALESAVGCKDSKEKMETLSQVDDAQELLKALATHIFTEYSTNSIPLWKTRLLHHELESDKPDFELLNQYWEPGMQIVEAAFAKLRKVDIPQPEDRQNAIAFFILLDNMGTHFRHFNPSTPFWHGPAAEPELMATQITSIFVKGITCPE